jgi:hypothetical protein
MARGPYTESETLRILRVLLAFVESDTPAKPLSKVGLRTGRHPFDWMLAGEGVPTGLTEVWTMDAAGVEALRLELRAFLRYLASDGQTPRWPKGITVTLAPLHVAAGAVKWIVRGSPRDVLCYQTKTFLDRIGGLERLRLCPAPDCGKTFLKIGRREFCSTRCQQRIYQRDYDPFAAKPRRPDLVPTSTQSPAPSRRHAKGSR